MIGFAQYEAIPFADCHFYLRMGSFSLKTKFPTLMAITLPNMINSLLNTFSY